MLSQSPCSLQYGNNNSRVTVSAAEANKFWQIAVSVARSSLPAASLAKSLAVNNRRPRILDARSDARAGGNSGDLPYDNSFSKDSRARVSKAKLRRAPPE